MRLLTAFVAAFLTASTSVAAAAVPAPAPTPAVQTRDVAGARDFADLPRFEGAHVRAWRQLAVAEITLPTGPVAEAGAPEKAVRLQGQIRHLDYVIRPAVNPLDIDRHYEEALRSAGYETVFSCTGITRCGAGMGALILLGDAVSPPGLVDGVFNDQLRVTVARKGSTWVLLHMTRGPDRSLVYQAVVEGARDVD